MFSVNFRVIKIVIEYVSICDTRDLEIVETINNGGKIEDPLGVHDFRNFILYYLLNVRVFWVGLEIIDTVGGLMRAGNLIGECLYFSFRVEREVKYQLYFGTIFYVPLYFAIDGPFVVFVG
jgi:hypothetical protein